MKNQLFDLVEFLILENDQEDLLLLQNIFEENKLSNKIRTVKTLNDIILLINETNSDQNNTHPEITLISLSSVIRKKDISSAIEELKNPALKTIELFIFTNDEVEEDLLKEHGIDFPTIRRPLSFCNFVDMVISKNDLCQAIIKPC